MIARFHLQHLLWREVTPSPPFSDFEYLCCLQVPVGSRRPIVKIWTCLEEISRSWVLDSLFSNRRMAFSPSLMATLLNEPEYEMGLHWRSNEDFDIWRTFKVTLHELTWRSLFVNLLLSEVSSGYLLITSLFLRKICVRLSLELYIT